MYLSHFCNVRSSRKTQDSSRTKRKVNVSNGQVLTDELVEKSDWSKRDVNGMVSRIRNGIKETGVNVESHIYDQLKKYDVKSGLFQQLHYNYNYNYRLKQALQDHNYAKDCWYDEQVLKPRFSVHNSDVWHAPLLPDNNITEDPITEDHQLVTGMLAPAEDQHVSSAPVTQNQTMYEHETVNVHVKQLEGIIEAAKGNLVSEGGKIAKDKGTTKGNQFELSISVPP
ncbi:hypothetical protein OS493_030377 [Desmophyllum pertusum]|uniref:Uncharacterized protein n=1 Tax=Desmophyllum pertusum TaxID=174260 RepID=A0A9W9Z8K1_9CNID|nr:hypothetical protein OS493_030377 [Desmophyllum pertusum]